MSKPVISICIPTYKRSDVLAITLEKLMQYNPAIATTDAYEIIVVDDFSNNPKSSLTYYSLQKKYPFCTIIEKPKNSGFSNTINLAMSKAKGEYILQLNDDIYVESTNWISQLKLLLDKNPHVGIVAPDYPGHHLRVYHKDFDEPDFIMGAVSMIRKSLYDSIGGYDESLSRQQEVDFSLRIRMSGFIPALYKGFSWKSENTAHEEDKGHEGVYKFFKKWNDYFLGKPFIYKSPFMLYWDQFPPIAMFRKRVFAQYKVNENIEKKSLQWHECDMIVTPWEPNRYREPVVRECIERDIILKEKNFEDVSMDLLIGKRDWVIEDNQ